MRPPAEAGQAAGDHRGEGGERGRRRARLRVPDPRRAGHGGHLHAHHPAAQIVGHAELNNRAAEHRRDDVGAAGHGQQRERGGQPAHQAEAGDRGAPHEDGDDDRAALPPDPWDPAGGDRAEQGAGPGRGVKKPEGLGPAAEHRECQRGEHGPRQAGAPLRDLRAHQKGHRDGGRHGRHVHPVDEADACPGEQQSGHGGPCDLADLEQRLEHGVDRGHLGPAGQVRQHG